MGVPKPTEDTITSRLSEELKKLGVKAQPFKSIFTPVGLRIPDLWCENGSSYVIEAKFTERDLLTAISKIQNDYLKYHKELGIKGGFAILYPKELSKPIPENVLEEMLKTLKFKVVCIFLPEDVRKNFTVFEGTLTEIAQELSKQILTPPEYVEPNVEWVIKTLREAANYITVGLKHLAGKQLEEIFGGEHVFKNILNYEEEEKYPTEELRLASAYLLVNQLLFYHVLSKKVGFPEIDTDKLKEPSQLNYYFKLALNVNYRAIFSYDVASKIPEKYVDETKKIINVIKGISPEKIGGDLLGTIFHDLIPLDVRKYVAAYYTNVLAANLLAWIAIDRHDAKVADFAVGSGGLLVAAYRRKKYLLELEGKEFDQKTHEKFLEQLLGVDVMPFAASVAASHLALQSPEYHTNKVNIAIWDSTELEPNMKIPSIASLKVVLKGQANLDMFSEREEDFVKGVVRLGEEKPEEITLTKYDVVIMNPPFTRQERIPEEYKQVLFDRFKEYEKYLHGQLGYHGYFILLADKFLKNGGRMALVLPATVLRLKSFEGIRRLLAEKYHVEYIVTTVYRSAFSESTRYREILLVAKKGGDGNSKTKIIILKRLPRSLEDANNFAEIIRNTDENFENDDLSINIVEYSKLKENVENWFEFIAIGDEIEIDTVLSSDKLIKFSDLIKKFKIEIFEGIESRKGAKVQYLTITRPERAIKKSDIWIIEKEIQNSILAKNRVTGSEVVIPKNSLRPALRRIALVDRIDISNSTDYVIVNRFKDEDDYFILDLEKGKPKDWDVWREYVENRLAHLVILRRGNISAPGTRLIAFYSSKPLAPPGVAWAVRCDDEMSKILCMWFNSTFTLSQIIIKRKETEGAFGQIDKYTLVDFLVLNPEKLNNAEKEQILETFEDVKDVRLPSILEQLETRHPIRKKIDVSILKVLGVEIDLDSFYDRIAQEIELLKSLMNEGKEDLSNKK